MVQEKRSPFAALSYDAARRKLDNIMGSDDAFVERFSQRVQAHLAQTRYMSGNDGAPTTGLRTGVVHKYSHDTDTDDNTNTDNGDGVSADVLASRSHAGVTNDTIVDTDDTNDAGVGHEAQSEAQSTDSANNTDKTQSTDNTVENQAIESQTTESQAAETQDADGSTGTQVQPDSDNTGSDLSDHGVAHGNSSDGGQAQRDVVGSRSTQSGSVQPTSADIAPRDTAHVEVFSPTRAGMRPVVASVWDSVAYRIGAVSVSGVADILAQHIGRQCQEEYGVNVAHQFRWNQYGNKQTRSRIAQVVGLYEQLSLIERAAVHEQLGLTEAKAVAQLQQAIDEAAEVLAQEPYVAVEKMVRAELEAELEAEIEHRLRQQYDLDDHSLEDRSLDGRGIPSGSTGDGNADSGDTDGNTGSDDSTGGGAQRVLQNTVTSDTSESNDEFGHESTGGSGSFGTASGTVQQYKDKDSVTVPQAGHSDTSNTTAPTSTGSHGRKTGDSGERNTGGDGSTGHNDTDTEADARDHGADATDYAGDAHIADTQAANTSEEAEATKDSDNGLRHADDDLGSGEPGPEPARRGDQPSGSTSDATVTLVTSENIGANAGESATESATEDTTEGTHPQTTARDAGVTPTSTTVSVGVPAGAATPGGKSDLQKRARLAKQRAKQRQQQRETGAAGVGADTAAPNDTAQNSPGQNSPTQGSSAQNGSAQNGSVQNGSARDVPVQDNPAQDFGTDTPLDEAASYHDDAPLAPDVFRSNFGGDDDYDDDIIDDDGDFDDEDEGEDSEFAGFDMHQLPEDDGAIEPPEVQLIRE